MLRPNSHSVSSCISERTIPIISVSCGMRTGIASRARRWGHKREAVVLETKGSKRTKYELPLVAFEACFG